MGGVYFEGYCISLEVPLCNDLDRFAVNFEGRRYYTVPEVKLLLLIGYLRSRQRGTSVLKADTTKIDAVWVGN